MNQIRSIIDDAKKIAILTHQNPDGDAIGSSFAMKNALDRYGKDSDCIMLCEIPEKYDIKEMETPYLIYSDDLSGYDCVICLDCATKERLGDAKKLLDGANTVNIDHHMTNTGYCKKNLVIDEASNGEIVFDVISSMGIEFDKKIAACIYVAIATDTGRFAYESVSGMTYKKAAVLADTGINLNIICDKIFSSRSYEATRLIGRAIDNLRLYFDGKMAVTRLSLDEMDELGVNEADCETVINYAREIKSVELAVFIRQLKREPELYKVSFRSKTQIDVSELCGIFGGGGHKRAAGCSIKGDINDVLDTIISHVKGYF